MKIPGTIGEMQKWTPLNDRYDIYVADLEVANAEGLLDDPEVAQEIAYPSSLHLSDFEKEDIAKFMNGRMTEILQRMEITNEFNPSHIASILFRGLIMGMEWQRERIG